MPTTKVERGKVMVCCWDDYCAEIDTSKMIRRSVFASYLCAVIGGQPLLARGCDIQLSSANLEADLDQVLGPWRSLARERHISIDPSNRACYIKIRIFVDLPDCAIEACSVATFQGEKIGLQAFDVRGCDALLAIIPLSRRVPTALAGASAEIRASCGPGAFEIPRVTPISIDGEPRIRVELRSVT
jgi:hypothetical protein